MQELQLQVLELHEQRVQGLRFSSLETGSASIISSGRDSAAADSSTSSRGEVRCQRCQELCSVVDGHGSSASFSKVDQDHLANGCICITMRGRRLLLQVARWTLRHQSHMRLRRRREERQRISNAFGGVKVVAFSDSCNDCLWLYLPGGYVCDENS